MGGYMNYGSSPSGYTLTTGPGGDGDMLSFAREMSRRAYGRRPPGGDYEGGGRMGAAPPRPSTSTPGDPNRLLRLEAEAQALRKMGTPEMSWQSLQGAATRPVGLGAQMIPGMAVDPRLLPPSMRPETSRIVVPPSPLRDFRQEEIDEETLYSPAARMARMRMGRS